MSHASVVLGLATASPSFVRKELPIRRKKFRGTSWQASSEMSRQTRASSSFTSRA